MYFCVLLYGQVYYCSDTLSDVSAGCAAQNDGGDTADGGVLEPMVKVSKVLDDNGDSIQYVEMNSVYVYPAPVFKNEKQRAAYNRSWQT